MTGVMSLGTSVTDFHLTRGLALLFSSAVAYLDRSFPDTEFVTDLPGMEIADTLKWEFTSYSLAIERAIPEHARHVWMLPKLFAQRIQTRPHVHVDLDLCCYQGLPSRVRNARVAVQSKDTPGWYFDPYVGPYLDACGVSRDTQAWNTAIMLWNDLPLRDEFVGRAIRVACDVAAHKDNGTVLSIIAEQALLAHFMRERRVKVTECIGLPTLLDDGEPRDFHFTHYWGRSKRRADWLRKAEERFAKDFPGKYADACRGWDKLTRNRNLNAMGVIK